MTLAKRLSFSSFEQAASQGEVVSLCAPMMFDHETAVTLADRFGDEPHFFLLESAAAGPGNIARYSFLGFDPLWSWQWSAQEPGTVKVDQNGKTRRETLAGGDPLASLRERVATVTNVGVYPEGVPPRGPDVTEFAGAFGFLGYDVASALEPSVGEPLPKSLGLPDAYFFVPRSFMVLDHLSKRLFVIRNVEIPQGASSDELKEVFDRESRALGQLLTRLKAVHSPPPLEIADSPLDFEACQATVSKPDFLEAVSQCLEEIRAGEIFQIQVGNRLSLETEARPFDIFRHLRILNPSPYMFFYKFDDHHIIGSSPELMVGVQGRRATHRPIAGTRKRTWDPKIDETMRRELTESEKERAEHVMLVDLSRNDLGRVCVPGTVRVEDLMAVEEYSHVFHMVSQVSGELREGLDAYDAMAASFPNGTVTGAPKIRAMQLIRDHEPVSREFYAGSLGVFDFRGNLKSTLLIRSLHVRDGVASTQASAGIVYDSVPEDEWKETRNKMAACLTAMQNTK